MSSTPVRELRQLSWAFVQAATEAFVRVGIWPRPLASRALRWGPDFVYDDLRGLPELHALNEWLESAPELLRMYDEHPGDHSGFAHVWFSLVTRTLLDSKGPTPDPLAFSRQFTLFSRELYRPTARMRRVTTLVGLDPKFERITLDDQTSLRRLPWLVYLAERLLDGQFGSHYGLVPGHDEHSVLVTEAVFPKAGFLSVAHRHVDDAKKLHSLETALRLYTRGVVRAGTIYEFHVAPFPLIEPESVQLERSSSFGGVLNWGEESAVIARRDIPRVTRLWRELMQGQFDERLWIAMRRFRSSYGEPFLDGLVDLTIAMEALFGPKEGEELTHRLRLRAAFLLGRGDEEARTIYRQVGTLYDIRSRVLHGRAFAERDYRRWLTRLTGHRFARFEPVGDVVERAVAIARELVRRSIVGAVGMSQNRVGAPAWPLPDTLDQDMATPRGKSIWRRSFQRAEFLRLRHVE